MAGDSTTPRTTSPYFGVATTLGASNFGQITSATDPRTLQFGLRVQS